MSGRTTHPFALCGAEKMIYDARMRPQALVLDDRVVIVYQAGTDGLAGQPHLIEYDRSRERWSAPQRLGTVSGIDHHFAPILWLDAAGRIHVLYDCHFSPGTHLVSRRPGLTDAWESAASLGASVTYPSVWRTSADRWLAVYRVEGHLGYWVWRTSRDGDDWSPERAFLDFDRGAADEVDRWAGTYVGVSPSRDGRCVHVGFCRWDERDGVHPRYTFRRDLLTRYDLYYLQLDLDSGRLLTADGRQLAAPVNRQAAATARVLDTGWELTNFPSVAAGPDDEPMMLVPVSEDGPWRCRFQFFRRRGDAWQRCPLAETDSTWSASRLLVGSDGTMVAWLVVGRGKGEECFYGGGTLQQWRSLDGGESWACLGDVVPEPGLLYNNPQPVVRPDGGELDDAFVLYGWRGPGGVWSTDDVPRETANRGRAYLWLDRRWV